MLKTQTPKHTPGPWQYGEFRITDTSDPEFAISQVYGAPYTTGPSDVAKVSILEGHRVEAEANARLIAAAPNLADALLEQEKYLSSRLEMFEEIVGGHNEDATTTGKQLAKVRAALREAGVLV